MSSDSVRLTKLQIDKIVYRLQTLNQTQREAVRELLYRMRDERDGKILKKTLRRELLELRSSYVISGIDLQAVENALFAD